MEYLTWANREKSPEEIKNIVMDAVDEFRMQERGFFIAAWAGIKANSMETFRKIRSDKRHDDISLMVAEYKSGVEKEIEVPIIEEAEFYQRLETIAEFRDDTDEVKSEVINLIKSRYEPRGITVLEYIGSGSYAFVVKVEYQGKEYALKLRKDIIDNMEEEFNILNALQKIDNIPEAVEVLDENAYLMGYIAGLHDMDGALEPKIDQEGYISFEFEKGFKDKVNALITKIHNQGYRLPNDFFANLFVRYTTDELGQTIKDPFILDVSRAISLSKDSETRQRQIEDDNAILNEYLENIEIKIEKEISDIKVESDEDIDKALDEINELINEVEGDIAQYIFLNYGFDICCGDYNLWVNNIGEISFTHTETGETVTGFMEQNVPVREFTEKRA